MDFETARAFAMLEFHRRHPKETWPDWVSSCSVVSGGSDEAGHWHITLTVTPKLPLHPDEHWEEKDGHKVLVRTNPATGKRMIVIHRTPLKVITIFEATVDAETAEVLVQTDMELSGIDGEDLECP